MGDSAIEAVVALSDLGQYVSVDVASMNTMVSDGRATTTRTTARACGSTRASTRPRCATSIPRPVIESLIRIYSYDVDFQHKAQPGDSFDVLFTADEETPATTPRTTCCSPR